MGFLDAETIKKVEIKGKIQKKYLRRTRKLVQTKLSHRNLIKGINTWAVFIVRYSGPFLKWTGEELKQMDLRTRKPMTMYKALHPRDDVEKLRVLRKEGGRGLASIKDSVDASIQQLKDYKEKHEGGLISAMSYDTNNTMDNKMTIVRKHKWEQRRHYGRFKRRINNITHKRTWTWLKKRNFKKEAESLLIAALNNAIRINHIKAKIDKTQKNRDKTINYIISECS